MNSSVHPTIKSESPMKKNQDIGLVSKKNKERENRNSVSSRDLVHEWIDKKDFITITLCLGPGHVNCSDITVTEDQELVVSLADGRKFQVQLYEKVNKDETTVSFKGHKCIIKLIKQSSIEWPSLEIQRSPLPDKNFQKQRESNKNLQTPKSQEIKMEVDEEECDNYVPVIKMSNVKTDMVERNTDSNLTLYLYITQLRTDSINVNFSSSLITVRFSTSDSSILKNYDNATEDSIFEWSVKPKYEILADRCSYKQNAYKLEIKLIKATNQMWSTISAIENSEDKPAVKNTWVSVGKGEVTNNSNIPLAPPPAIKKKPTLSVTSAKASSSSSKAIMSYPLSPLGAEGGSSMSSVTARGLVGLENIGNTCFMNSVLQCLVNTTELRNYFQGANFQQDLNKDNPLGMGGKLAVSFAVLMKKMWSGEIRSFAPSKLKSVMSLKANQFSGFAQHDAQEFMVELLDGLHEDLNRVKKKPYIAEPPDLDGWSDQDAAEESWRLHKLRNDSIIDDLFKGQFKSTLTCHECNKISAKFDEFCCLSVPIPKDQKTIQVIFFWRDTSKQPKKFLIRLAHDALVEDLKRQLSNVTDVHPSAIQVIEANK